MFDKKTYLKNYLKIPWTRTLHNIRGRVNRKNGRYRNKGIKNFITSKELKELWFRDKAYLLKKPSIDRIDNDDHYSIKNCRYIELSENTRSGNSGKDKDASCVSWDGPRKMWRVQIRYKQKTYWGGRYRSKIEAKKAVLKFKNNQPRGEYHVR